MDTWAFAPWPSFRSQSTEGCFVLCDFEAKGMCSAACCGTQVQKDYFSCQLSKGARCWMKREEDIIHITYTYRWMHFRYGLSLSGGSCWREQTVLGSLGCLNAWLSLLDGGRCSLCVSNGILVKSLYLSTPQSKSTRNCRCQTWLIKTKKMYKSSNRGAEGVQQDLYHYHRGNISHSVMKAFQRSTANLLLELTLPLKFDSALYSGFSFVFTEKHK